MSVQEVSREVETRACAMLSLLEIINQRVQEQTLNLMNVQNELDRIRNALKEALCKPPMESK